MSTNPGSTTTTDSRGAVLRRCRAMALAFVGFAVPFSTTVDLAPANAPQQLYVAPNGDDAGPGTSEQPFATLHRAQQAVRRGRPA